MFHFKWKVLLEEQNMSWNLFSKNEFLLFSSKGVSRNMLYFRPALLRLYANIASQRGKRTVSLFSSLSMILPPLSITFHVLPPLLCWWYCSHHSFIALPWKYLTHLCEQALLLSHLYGDTAQSYCHVQSWLCTGRASWTGTPAVVYQTLL